MKLVELAKKAINLLQDAGDKGFNNIDLAQKLHMPRRRVYDIIAILRAAGLVEAKREKGGTRIKWRGIPVVSEVKPDSSVSHDLTEKLDKITEEKNELESQIDELKDKILKLKEEQETSTMEVSTIKTKFEVQKISIKTLKSAKITKVQTSPIEIILEADKKGFVIEPG
ncbi:MAG: hypothetical protein HWN67_01645 [Candidatus Helarchaeota archaeon]|nr:hypothetical protein [Candidatus Helarchaeota archaeon]